MQRTVYLDNNATTRTAPEVVEAMLPFFGERYGNPSSMHAFGGGVAKDVAAARERAAAFLNCSPDEVIFTSCATEADNTAIRGTAAFYGRDRLKVVTTAVEHPAVLQSVRRLKAEGFETVELGVDGCGRLDLERLRAELRGPKKCLVSAMWANNETGTVFPVAEISELAREAGAVFHTDAVQAAGKIPLDVRKVPVDFLALSGHKFHAPKGIGLLYARRGAKWKPFMLGGHQEGGRRAGTENVPYAVGLARACELAMADMAGGEAKMAAMRDRLEAGILASCPDVRVNGDVGHRLANTLNVSFEFVEGEAIAYGLSDAGICVSTGSACASGSLDPSHVIRAMGVPFTAVHGSVRFSFSRYNVPEDVDYVLERLPPVIRRLRELSPFGPRCRPSTFA